MERAQPKNVEMDRSESIWFAVFYDPVSVSAAYFVCERKPKKNQR